MEMPYVQTEPSPTLIVMGLEDSIPLVVMGPEMQVPDPLVEMGLEPESPLPDLQHIEEFLEWLKDADTPADTGMQWTGSGHGLEADLFPELADIAGFK
jgi:hypothetical protein